MFRKTVIILILVLYYSGVKSQEVLNLSNKSLQEFYYFSYGHLTSTNYIFKTIKNE